MERRVRPWESIEGLMSETVTVAVVSLFMCVACSRRRKAMSPVPEAMSRIFWGWGG